MTQLTEQDLKALMLSSLDGDEVAYRRLLNHLRQLLVSYFTRRTSLSYRSEVDDLVQETLLALHHRKITYDRQRPFTAWFFTIARYKLVDHHRKRGNRAMLGMEAIEDMPDEFSEDAVSASMDVEKLLGQLPQWQGDLIRQVRLEGQSVADTAAGSGRTEGMVKVGVHRGIKALAAKLRGERGEDR
jgi:RNA polymerase sigma-70 factor (ECF subfamily)